MMKGRNTLRAEELNSFMSPYMQVFKVSGSQIVQQLPSILSFHKIILFTKTFFNVQSKMSREVIQGRLCSNEGTHAQSARGRWLALLWGQREGGTLPATASSACGRTRGGSRRRRPRACCGPGSAGCRCRGPAGKHTNGKGKSVSLLTTRHLEREPCVGER